MNRKINDNKNDNKGNDKSTYDDYIDIVGRITNYSIGVQDGLGRVQHYWNSTRGPDNKYVVSNENSFKLDLSVENQKYFKIKHAGKGTAGQSINWNEHLTIRNNGWVGINRTNPSYRLDVGGTLSMQNKLAIKGVTSDYYVSVQDGSGRVQNYWNSTRGPDNENKYLISDEESFKLDLGVTRDPYYKIKHAAKGVAGDVISWNEHFVIKQNGNIGIGKANPTSKLDVGGSINFSGNLTKDGNALKLSDFITDATTLNDAKTTLGVPTAYTFPTSDGTSGQSLVTDGSGTLSFSTVSGSQWTASNSNIYYNDGNVSIGNTEPMGKLHIGGNTGYTPFGDTLGSLVDNSLIVLHPTQTSSTAIDDPKTTLYLGRNGTAAQSNPAGAFFNICRSENSGTNSKTRLDIDLRTNWETKSNVMTMLDSGNIGFGTTSPGEKIEAKGNLYLNNYLQSGSSRTGGKLLFDASFDTGGNGAEGPQKIDLYAQSGDYGFGVEGSTTTYFSSNKHKWYTTSGSTTARMMLDNDKLGIGTTSPEYELDVNGSARISDTVHCAGIINTASDGLDIKTNYGTNEKIHVVNQQGAADDAVLIKTEGGGGIEINSSGKLFVKNLPTTDPNEDGQIWNDNGVLKISSA